MSAQNNLFASFDSTEIIDRSAERISHATSLASRTVLTSLHVTAWSGHKTDKTLSQELCESNNTSKKHLRARKSLVGDNLKKIQQAENMIRSTFATNSLPWGEGGSRIIKISKLDDFRKMMIGPIARFHEAVEEFLEDYSRIKAEAEENLGRAFNKNDYPGYAELRRKFSIELQYMALPRACASDFRDSSISKEEAAQIVAETERALKTRMETAYENIRDRLRAPLQRYAERLKMFNIDENGKTNNCFRNSLVGNIHEIVEIAPSLNIMDDPIITELCKEIDRDLSPHTPEELRMSPELRESAAARAEQIVDQLDRIGL